LRNLRGKRARITERTDRKVEGDSGRRSAPKAAVAAE
jgi:hypothetical protein